MRPSPKLRPLEGGAPSQSSPDLGECSEAELLVVWALRMRSCHGHNGLVPGFRLAFGLSGIEQALARFEAMYALLQCRCSRPITLHAPAFRQIGRDEVAVVRLIATLQADREGPAQAPAQAIAMRLVAEGAAASLVECAGALAAVMREHGLLLPLEGLASRDRAQLRLVH